MKRRCRPFFASRSTSNSPGSRPGKPRSTPQGGDKQDRANFARIKTAVEANVKLLTETPLQFAVAREGEKIEPLNIAALSDPSQVPALTAQLQQRATTVAELRKKYGPQVRNRILLPQEASMIVSTIEKLPPAQKGEVFGALRRVAGSTAVYGAMMGQIAKDAPVMAAAGLLQLRNEKAAKLVIMGESLLNRTTGTAAEDGKFKMAQMPEQAEFERVIGDEVGNAFRDRPEAYSRGGSDGARGLCRRRRHRRLARRRERYEADREHCARRARHHHRLQRPRRRCSRPTA